MKTKTLAALALMTLLASACVQSPAASGSSAAPEEVPLKEAKLIIEHNATDRDTGFQGFVDSEGWKSLTVTGPQGTVLTINGQGGLKNLGLTELFFETVEPENKDVPIQELLGMVPEGQYTLEGISSDGGTTRGVAWLTHTIPAGPVLLTPAEGAVVSAAEDLFVSWSPVTKTIEGKDVTIVSYQLIIEKDAPPHPNMIGKIGLSMYLSATVTSITIPSVFFEAGKKYNWEVLAIEESGNQTLSSGAFQTQ